MSNYNPALIIKTSTLGIFRLKMRQCNDVLYNFISRANHECNKSNPETFHSISGQKNWFKYTICSNSYILRHVYVTLLNSNADENLQVYLRRDICIELEL